MDLDINTNKRLFDLVRYSRSALHEEGLITDEEYAWLCSGCEMAQGKGSPSPRRLEDYDAIRDRMDKLESALKALVASCVPRPSEHPLLYQAWDHARQVLKANDKFSGERSSFAGTPC